MNRYFVDALSMMSNSGEIVKIDFVNVDNENGEVVVKNELGIAMTISSFFRMRESMNELYEKISSNPEIVKDENVEESKTKKKKTTKK